MSEYTPEDIARFKAAEDAQWARGICPHTGYTRHICHVGPCDCFDSDNCKDCKTAR